MIGGLSIEKGFLVIGWNHQHTRMNFMNMERCDKVSRTLLKIKQENVDIGFVSREF